MFDKERNMVAEIMRRLYSRKLTTASGGNVSLRNEDGYIFITASQTDKAVISADQIIILSPAGENLTPELKPSMETEMHKEIYAVRKDVNAIVHAHPVYATTYAIAGKLFSTACSGEARFVLGELGIAEYELMGTKALAYEVAKVIKSHDVALMKNHGAIAVANNLFNAFNRMEVLEDTAQMNFCLSVLSAKSDLSEEKLSEIDMLK